ncbi:FAD-binding oxidoreductase [Nostocoides japonicum]|uniref:FAD-binding oxidoreductase n=1 Tax=Nostocoides japonicum TaxID=99481 RepID=UPI001F24EFB7|nr:FAD-binding oxidoreductase [Tetrasphaera japonica]
MRRAASPHLTTSAAHEEAVAGIRAQYAAIPRGEPVRLAKRTSNLFRPRAATTGPGLDVAALDRVIAVDPVARTARVQGMTTYEHLVDATLPHGLMPFVVPQLKTITLGGAVTGLGIESSSFRNGLPHESVREMEILTGAGEVVRATPDGEHADLFRTFPNSYGSLGYALSLTIDLEPVHPWVVLHHVRFASATDATGAIEEVMTTGAYAGEHVDFVDGVVFTGTEMYLTLGSWADRVPDGQRPSDYTGMDVYYRSIQHRTTDVLSVRDYLWRWDTDWFWCSRAFGAQSPRIRRLWPKKWLRSDVYWKLIRFENTYHVAAWVDARRGQPPRERVVQDVEIPVARLPEFIDWFLAEVPIEPIWLCPIRLRDKATPDGANGGGEPAAGIPWPLYPMHAGEQYVNVGFWSTVPIEPGRADGDVNRLIEAAVDRLGGHKSLYSDAFYDRESFDALYGGETYAIVKKTYDPDGRLPSLYDKAVRAR